MTIALGNKVVKWWTVTVGKVDAYVKKYIGMFNPLGAVVKIIIIVMAIVTTILGLGGTATKVKDIIVLIRNKIELAVDWLVQKLEGLLYKVLAHFT